MNDATPERWLPVPGYEGFYEASDQGRIRSVPHRTSRGMRGGHILKPGRMPKGYLFVNLSVHGNTKREYVHRLVAVAFNGPRPEGMQCRHLDGDFDRNVPANLAWGTSSENKFDTVRHGRHHLANRESCDQDHLFSPENTIIRLRPDGSFRQRVCRICLTGWRATARARRSD